MGATAFKVRSRPMDTVKMSHPQSFDFCCSDCVTMHVFTLLTVGLLGDGFMLYALIHWMRDDVRHRKH
jgi:hypothetical protein